MATVEARARVRGILEEFIDLGVTVFGDVGAVWRGDVPYGVDSGVRGALGAGLRVGFPPGSSTAIRADIAFPLGPGRPGNNPVFRISAVEWVGILNDFRSPDLQRSRRSGIVARYTGVAREGSPW